jgi:hypothetical protein
MNDVDRIRWRDPHALRLLVTELATLREVREGKLRLDQASPYRLEDVQFLRDGNLVAVDGTSVTVTERGRKLLELEPENEGVLVLKFDRRELDDEKDAGD